LLTLDLGQIYLQEVGTYAPSPTSSGPSQGNSKKVAQYWLALILKDQSIGNIITYSALEQISMGERDDEVIRAGMMRKRGATRWSDRYFVLKGPILYYYTKKTDTVGSSIA
jgi:hypothetical protein